MVIGIGNPYRRDDGVGLTAAREIQGRAGKGVSVIELDGEGAALLEAWRDAEAVFVVDAIRSGAEPGTLRILDAISQALPAEFFRISTHAFSLAEAVELGRALGRLPRQLIVFGVEGEDYSAGEGLTPNVRNALPVVVEEVLKRIQSLRTRRRGD